MPRSRGCGRIVCGVCFSDEMDRSPPWHGLWQADWGMIEVEQRARRDWQWPCAATCVSFKQLGSCQKWGPSDLISPWALVHFLGRDSGLRSAPDGAVPPTHGLRRAARYTFGTESVTRAGCRRFGVRMCIAQKPNNAEKRRGVEKRRGDESPRPTSSRSSGTRSRSRASRRSTRTAARHRGSPPARLRAGVRPRARSTACAPRQRASRRE